MSWSGLGAEAQQDDPESFLNLYRTALALRRERLVPLPETLTWVDAGPGTVCFDRQDGFRCLLNASPAAIGLPDGARVLLASGPLPDGAVPPDTTVWLSL